MAHVLAKDLRDAVLQAAVQGRLSKTLSSDTPVYQTIENFKYEKNQLLLHKNMKDRNRFQDIDSGEHLFDIPVDWAWVRINDIGVFKKGPFGSALTKSMFVKKSSTTIKVYEQKNAIQKNHLLGDYYITEEYYNTKMKGFKVEPGDIIVSCAGTIGEVYIIPKNAESGIINQALMRMNIINSINLDYFMIVFEHILKEEARSNSGGTAIKNIPPFEVFKAMPFPLPPIEEQARIVAKVDELMAKIDEYEKLEKELVDLKKNFPGDMKASVLQAAMEGKLTKQLNTDSDVLNYVEDVINLKKDLIKNKVIKKDKTNVHFDYDDIPFDIPNNWMWVKFGNIANLKTGKTPPRSEPNWWGNSNDISWVSISDMIGDSTILKTKEFISTEGIEEIFKSSISLKCTMIMSFKLTVGRVSILGMDAVHNEAIISIFPYKDNNNILQKYLFKVLPYLVQYGDSKNAIKGETLNQDSLCNLLIPLPPIEEQQRIVEKLDKLLPLCDALCE